MVIDFEKGGGLVPAIVQDAVTGKVLMLGYMNKEAYELTLEKGLVTFFSRSRGKLWTKGETSGNYLNLRSIAADCDGDTLLVKAIPAGPVCHTGSWTCFQTTADRNYNLDFLSGIIKDRFANPTPGSYTATLTDERVREKIMEEAEELTEAEGKEEVIWECADLIYFMAVLMNKENVSWQDVLNELDRRHKK